MPTKDFIEVVKAVLSLQLDYVRDDPPYKENKYNSSEYTAGLNEGYAAGIRAAIRKLDEAAFLA